MSDAVQLGIVAAVNTLILAVIGVVTMYVKDRIDARRDKEKREADAEAVKKASEAAKEAKDAAEMFALQAKAAAESQAVQAKRDADALLAQTKAIGEKAATHVLEVRNALATTTSKQEEQSERQDAKLGRIEDTGNKIHVLTNSRLGRALEVIHELASQKAERTKDPTDIARAVAAKQDLDDHNAKQDVVNHMEQQVPPETNSVENGVITLSGTLTSERPKRTP